MLYGRDAERAALAGLRDRALAGAGGALVLSGGPGTGKSALLAALGDEEATDRVRVLRTRGVEAESPLAFAALQRLLRPLRAHLGRLPARQARALRAAFGEEESAADPYLVYLGTLSLLAEAAAQQPLLVLVDDAHWLDDASAAALLFTARRVTDDPVAVLFAARDDAGFEAADLPVLRLGGLDLGSATALLADRVGTGIPPSVVDALVAETDGNPLALVEIPAALRPEQLAGATALPARLPVTQRLEQVFLERVRLLGAAAQTVLLLVATDDTGQAVTVRRAAAELGLPADAFAEAERSGLVTATGGEAMLRHPLVGSAVYAAATGDERRRVHAALARTVGDPERRAWHRAAVAEEPDEDVAAALVEAAELARRRGGQEATGAALARAAELTADPALRGERRAEAALATWLAGRPAAAAELGDRALAEIDDPVRHAEALVARARIEWNTGDLVAGQRMVLQAAAGLAGTTPARARELAMVGAALGTVGADSGIDPGTVVPPAARADPARERCVDALLTGLRAVPRGDWATAGPALQTAVGLADAVESGNVDVLPNLGIAALHLQDDDAALRLHDRLLADARTQSATIVVLYALTRRALAEISSGRWTAAGTSAAEALQIARATGRPGLTAFPAAQLALLDALRGTTGEPGLGTTLDDVETIARAHPLGTVASTVRDLVDWAHAHLAGIRSSAALARLDRLGPSMVARPAALDQLEAAAAGGGPLLEWTADLEEFAAGTGSPWAAAVAAHGRALHDGDPAHFARAVELHARSPRRFDAARTRLAFGEHLRRAGRRVDARAHLRAALATFDELGATAWSERARTELRASGETTRRRVDADTPRLTPTELQVARLVADGLANREVAAQLFVSPRTVDFHLRNIFAKAGISSRAEIARLSI